MVALLKGRYCNKCLFPQNGFKENCFNRRKTKGDIEQGQGEGKNQLLYSTFKLADLETTNLGIILPI